MTGVIGKVLFGKYELCKQIGAGGSGVVYLAWDRHLERYVVVKAEKQLEESKESDTLRSDILKKKWRC